MKNYLLAVLIAMATLTVNAQGVRTVSDPDKGQFMEYGQTTVSPSKFIADDPSVMWVNNQQYSIGGQVFMPNNHNVLTCWATNSSRLSYYHGISGTIFWEMTSEANTMNGICSTNKAGTAMIVPDGSTLYVVDPSTGMSTNEIAFPGSINRCLVDEAGTCLFVAYTSGSSYFITRYELNASQPTWTIETTCNVVGLSIPADGCRLAISFAQGYRTIWIVDPETGDVIQDNIGYYDNSPTQYPAMSADGEFLTFGDFTGKAYLYRWNGEQYYMVWKANIAGESASSTWGCANAISADGSTIAIGTLDFVPSGYNGCIYVFNNYSPEPVWVYTNVGDEVEQIAISDNGDVIACASAGPLNHSSADLFVFRKQSNVPLAAINTPGSFEYVAISGDGNFCVATGKAVHIREMGYGGMIYYLNCVPQNTGTLAGTVTLEGEEEYSDVKVMIADDDSYYTSTLADGSFSIRFIPAGTYTVTFSKPGFFSQTLTNVQIASGETTSCNVELEPAGQPIEDLLASKGAYSYVNLLWSGQSNAVAYNVYRKSVDFAPFTELIATVENAYEYIDDTAEPKKIYYYAVTAVLSDGSETAFSNVCEGYVATTKITAEIDVYRGTAPTIDGIMSDGEWDDAYTVDVSNYVGITTLGNVILHFKMDSDYLYVCSENHCDIEFNNNDGVAFYIDDNNDGVFADDDSEGNYWMYYGTPCTVRYRPIHSNGGVGTTINLPEEIIATSLSTGYEIIEFALPFGDSETWMINPGENNNSGMYLFVRDAATSTMFGKWPAENDNTFSPVDYGVINYDVDNTVPAPPTNLTVDREVLRRLVYAPVSWDMPAIHDFGHFNVYVNSDEPTAQVEGTEIILDIEQYNDYSIYVTTVDASGQESEHSETLTFNTDGINEITSSFTVYPNPASTDITVSSDITTGGAIKIVDMSGRIVKSLNSSDLSLVRISVDDLSRGVYLTVISYDNTVVVRKFIVK